MPSLKFGVALGQIPYEIPDLETICNFATKAEQFGFDSYWQADHLLMYTPVHETFVVLAAVMARTTNIKIGSSVLLLPQRNAAHVAKTVATLDYLSGGRFQFGVGVGGEFEKEWELAGVEIKDRRRRMEESILVCKKLWTEERATFQGKFYRFNDVTMIPKPIQKPHPPIWIGGRSDAALERAGRVGDGWLGYWLSPERYLDAAGKIREAAEKAHRDPEKIALAWYGFILLDDQVERARATALTYLNRNYGGAFEDQRRFDRYIPIGTAGAVAERLKPYRDLGIQEFHFQFPTQPQNLLEQLQRVNEELLPLLQT